MIADLTDGVGTHAFDLRMLGHHQEQLQQRAGAVEKDVGMAQLDVAASNLEACVDRLDLERLARVEDHLVEMLQQHVVEPGQRGDMAIVGFHELLDRETLRRVGVAEQLGQGALMIEQQAVFGAFRDHVQCIAHLPQEGLALAQNPQFGVVHEALGDDILVAQWPEMALGHPADHLDVAQPAWRTLEVGLEMILGVVVLEVAANLLLPFALEKRGRGPHVPGR